MVQGLSVSAIVFYARDLERTAAFYRDVLGLATRSGNGTEDGRKATFLIAEAGHTLLIVFQGEPAPGKTPIVVFGLEEGIEDVVEELAAKGVEIVVPVSEAPGGLTADFLDPDGHILSFYQSLEAAGTTGEAS